MWFSRRICEYRRRLDERLGARNCRGEGALHVAAKIAIDADGHIDLAVVNFQGNDVSVLLGNGDGTFQEPVVYAPGNEPNDVAICDLDDDGAVDLAVCVSSFSVEIFLGNGDGTFQEPPVAYEVG